MADSKKAAPAADEIKSNADVVEDHTDAPVREPEAQYESSSIELDDGTIVTTIGERKA